MSDFPATLSLSVAAPAFNESDGIHDVVLEWFNYLKQQHDITQFEIVICNDGSTDNTGEILDKLSKQYPEIKPIHLRENQGAASALAHAISQTQFDWVLLTDSDNQFPIKNLSAMISALRTTHAKAALGIRQKKNNVFARFGSASSGLICNIVHGTKIKDFNSAFKLVYGSLLRSFKLEAKGLNYSTEITSRLLESGTTIVEVNIDHQPRKTGKSSMKFVRDSMHRLLFVFYISLRQLLIKIGTLRRPL